MNEQKQKGFGLILGLGLIVLIVVAIGLFILAQRGREFSTSLNSVEKTENQQTTTTLDPDTANSELDKIDASELDAELNKLDADTSTF